MIFDTHAHYDDEAFDNDRETILNNMTNNGVCNIINAGTNLKTSEISETFSKKYDFMFFAAGIHPEYAMLFDDETIKQIADLLKLPKAVAVGEIGLDYHYDDMVPAEKQVEVFDKQLRLANDMNKPVIVHDRDAHQDTYMLLRKYKPKGVVHCFSGSVPLAKEAVDLGMYIGVGGVVTFKNAKKLVNVVHDVPIDRILLETDAPYMAPVPFRGKRCDSTMIYHVAQKIGEIKGLKTEEVLDITRLNAKKCFLNY